MSFEKVILDELVGNGLVTADEALTFPTAIELAEAYEFCAAEITQQAESYLDKMYFVGKTKPFFESRAEVEKLYAQWYQLNDIATSWCRATADDLRSGNSTTDMDMRESAFETYHSDLQKIISLRRENRVYERAPGVEVNVESGVTFEKVFSKLPERCKRPFFENPARPADAALN
jgi:polyhydroxyalkanoate synthesis regulator phasin